MGSDCQWTHPANDTSAINNGTATNTGNAFSVNVVMFKKPGLFLQSSRHAWNHTYYVYDFGQVT